MRKRRWGKPRTKQSGASRGPFLQGALVWVVVALSFNLGLSIVHSWNFTQAQDKAIIAVQVEAGDALQAHIVSLRAHVVSLQAELARRNKAYDSCVEAASWLIEQLECLDPR